MSPITSRELIARQAQAAAQRHAQQSAGTPLPLNPYCRSAEPDHHREWAASFERALQNEQAPECEASA